MIDIVRRLIFPGRSCAQNTFNKSHYIVFLRVQLEHYLRKEPVTTESKQEL